MEELNHKFLHVCSPHTPPPLPRLILPALSGPQTRGGLKRSYRLLLGEGSRGLAAVVAQGVPAMAAGVEQSLLLPPTQI